MVIGYACKVMGVTDVKLKGMILKNVSEELLSETIAFNLKILENMLDYNISRGIKMFRISSDIIPFGSHPANTLEWWKTFEVVLQSLGERIKGSGMRVSMHPGQYTVLNSPDEGVVNRGIQDLIYHTRFLDTMCVDGSNKIILHIGGVYGDKDSAGKRFAENWLKLPEQVRKRLVIENDEKCYNISDVLQIGSTLGIPVVFDNLHNSINPPETEQLSPIKWIEKCKVTWRGEDGRQKIHYSQQSHKGQKGAHSDTIHIRPFLSFYKELSELAPDIMLEVKDKNISAVKCINCTAHDVKRSNLEREWAAYKYAVMEKSYKLYSKIGGLFGETEWLDAVEFYEKLEDAASLEPDIGNAINTAEHIWGYFKKKADESEKKRYQKLLAAAKVDAGKLNTVKRFLLKLAQKYEEKYLIGSYYFMEV